MLNTNDILETIKMIRDENLRNTFDYSEGQKATAHRVLVELVNLFDEYRDEIRIVGGWVPDLMFPGEGHVGSVDVDVEGDAEAEAELKTPKVQLNGAKITSSNATATLTAVQNAYIKDVNPENRYYTSK